VVGDPKNAIYTDFGIEASLGLMSLKALGAGMRGMARGHFGLRLAGGPLGAAGRLPDRAVRTDQRVKYGTDAYDQWSADELLTLAKGVATHAL
jgi:hypothetical protein